MLQLEYVRNKYFGKQFLWTISLLIVFLLIWMVFANFLPPRQAFVRAAIAFFFFGSVIVLNLNWLIPRFLHQQKFFLYLILIATACVTLGLIRYFVESRLEIDVGVMMRNISLSQPRKIVILCLNHSLAALLSVTYYFGREWIEVAKRQALLKTERLEAEINFLKAQVNPHFLFNTLHNLYSMSYLKDERTPGLLLKLSEIMRYLIYECNQAQVPLANEVMMIHNYLDLQKVKNKGYEKITFEVDRIEDAVKIPPLLIIPFVENIFKHSDIDSNSNGWGYIRLEFEHHKGLTLITHNTMKQKTWPKQNGGFGLTNVTKRLELLYSEKFALEIDKKESEFKVQLHIPFP